ncbi:autoinducer 2 ABC transporter substrate-binding protein, partial [Mesorhizobium sp. M7A.F.Ca.CA.004.05.1.1]
MLSQFKKVLAASALSLAIATAAHAADKHKVAFVPQLIGIPYFNAMEAGGNRAAKDLGLDFIYSGPVDTN